MLTTAVVGAGFMSISSANLEPSTFEGSDGNVAVDTAENFDWINALNRVVGQDLTSGSKDNALGQGSKEDDPAVKVGQGSIPKNKSDLTRFYLASEFVGSENYMYLAWERANTLGSANMDFEINQAKTVGFDKDSTGPIIVSRTAGDMLITFDFSGGGTPILGLLRWVTSGAASQCFSASSLPCWGNREDLSGFAEGAVNSGTFTDSIVAGDPEVLPAGTFGEAAVNLSAAGVFPPGGCTTFGSAFLKSRSSTSFTSEVKDFIAPQSVNISNCGTIKITKQTENDNRSFGFSTGGLTPAGFSLSNGQTQTFLNVPSGTYTVSESTPLPAGWTLVGLGCTTSGSGTSATTPANSSTATITIAGGGFANCTFRNRLRLNPSLSTAQSILPNDQATITGATNTAGGTVTFELFDPTDATCSGTADFSETATVNGNGNYTTHNTTFLASTPGTWQWKVTYSGDAANVGTTSGCGVEHFTITNG